MIETYLSGQAGLDWIAAALFAVGLTLLISDALLPGLGPGGVIGLICQIACFAPDLVGGSSAWSVLVLAAVGSALLLVDGRLAGIGPIGILGAVLLLAALWQTAQDAYIFLLTLCASAVMTGIAIPLQLARLPDSKSMKKIQLYARSEIPEQSPDELPQIGMLGVTRTDLRPVGTVEISEKRYEAVSAQHLRRGEAVRVVSVQGRRLRVEKAEEN